MISPDLGEAWISISRARLAMLTIASTGMGAASAAVVIFSDTATDHVAGLIGVLLFGGGAGVFVWRMTSPGGVRLTRDGFTTNPTRRGVVRAWSDVEDFQVVRVGHSSNFVGYRLRNPAHRTMSMTNRALTGVDALLPSPLSVQPKDLVPIMESWRARYGSGAAERS